MNLQTTVAGVDNAATEGDAVRVARIVASAEQACREGGLRLTPIRRRVLELLLANGSPRGAYDLADELAAGTGKRFAPITVYRALDFLVANGFVHRIESRNAYLASTRGAGAGPSLLLVCESCGRVAEGGAEAMMRGLARAAALEGFVVSGRAFEIPVRCTTCA